MPIGNISKAGKSFTGAAEYDLAQGRYIEQENSKKPEILEQNFVFGNDYKDLGKQFREVSNYNKRVQSPVMKISINFDPKEELSDAKKLAFTKSVMKEMGVTEDGHQYMITRHSDKKHDHYHILANRVGLDGKAVDYSHSVPRLEKSIDKVEKGMGLSNMLSKSRRFVYDSKSEKGYQVQSENFRNNRENVSTRDKKSGIPEKKEYIKTHVSNFLKESKSFTELQSKLQEKDISAEARFNKDNKLSGISFRYAQFSVKGSALGKEFKASSIEQEFERKAVYREKETLPGTDRAELRRETLRNLDQAIVKIEPYSHHNSQVYDSVKGVREGVQTHAIHSTEDLQRANEMAKKHILKIEAHEQKAQQNRFDQAREAREARKEQEQEQDQQQKRNRGFRR